MANPTNSALESGEWTKSIIWEPNAPFRSFTQLELREVEEVQQDYAGTQGGKSYYAMI
jgi:transcription initiation factor TFIID subunit 1